MPLIEKDYIKTGKVKYIVRDFPLEAIHKQAFKAAEATRCAGEQGKYWEMHERLFADPKALDPKGLSDSAQALKLDMSKFQPCLDSGKYAAAIRKDMADANPLGVRGTPAFFLGLADPSDPKKFKATRQIRGADAFSGFQANIDALLSGDN